MRALAEKLLKEKAPKSRAYRGMAQVREHGETQAEAWLKAGLEA
jgi:hypothetical protein